VTSSGISVPAPNCLPSVVVMSLLKMAPAGIHPQSDPWAAILVAGIVIAAVVIKALSSRVFNGDSQ
jgi:hypothetical protein